MEIEKIQTKDNEIRTEQVQKKQAEYTLVGKQRKVAGHHMYYPCNDCIRWSPTLGCEIGKFCSALIYKGICPDQRKKHK